jgi:hypothetical protein
MCLRVPFPLGFNQLTHSRETPQLPNGNYQITATMLYMQKLLIAFMFVKLILSLNSCDLMDEIDSIWGTWGMQNLGNN